MGFGGGTRLCTEMALRQQRMSSETPEDEHTHLSQEKSPLRPPELLGGVVRCPRLFPLPGQTNRGKMKDINLRSKFVL